MSQKQEVYGNVIQCPKKDREQIPQHNKCFQFVAYLPPDAACGGSRLKQDVMC